MTNQHPSIIPFLEQFNTSSMLEQRIILMMQDPNIAEIEVGSRNLYQGRIIDPEGKRLIRRERVEGWSFSSAEQKEFEARYLAVLYPSGGKMSFDDARYFYNEEYLVIKKK